MAPKKRGGRTRGSAAKTKAQPSAGAEGILRHGEMSSLVPALRPVTPMRGGNSRAGSEALKQVRIKSPTPSRTPPFIGGIVGQASPERIRSSQSYEELLGSPSPSALTKPIGRGSNTDSPLSPSFSDLPIVGEVDYSSDARSEMSGAASARNELSSDAEPPLPSLDHLPTVGEWDYDGNSPSDMDANASTAGEYSDRKPVSLSVLHLLTSGEWGSDADGGSKMSHDDCEPLSYMEYPSPTLVDLPIVGEWESSDAPAESTPITDELVSDMDVRSPSLKDLPVVGEWDSDTGASPSRGAEGGLAGTTRRSVLTVQEIALSLQKSPFPTVPADWGLYQQYLLRRAEGRFKPGDCSK